MAVVALSNAVGVAFVAFMGVGAYFYNREVPDAVAPAAVRALRLSPLVRLDTLTRADHEWLEQYFSRDYRWWVTTSDGRRVAFLRGGSAGDRRHGSNGYQGEPGAGIVQSRLAIDLDGPGMPKSLVPFDIAEIAGGVTLLRLFDREYGGPPRYMSRVSVPGNTLRLEVFEDSPRPERVESNRLVADLGGELNRVLSLPRISEALDNALEPDSIGVTDAPTLSIDAHEPDTDPVGVGVYTASGYVNAGEAGAVEIRVVESGTNKELPVTGMPAASEVVGWSEAPTTRYRYGFKFILDGGPEDAFRARCELWFHPKTGGGARRLNSVERLVRRYVY